MKKILFSFVLIAMCAAAFSQNLKGKRIVVVEPKMQNTTENEKWISFFVQGQVTTNFQNYSGMSVIDRQNQDKTIKEQKLSVSAAYDEDEQIEIGKLLAAQYVVAISIIKKGSGYAIDAKINDTKTNQTVGKAYSNPNCPAAQLEGGSELYEMSYQLLSGIGVDSKTLSELRKAAKNEAHKKEVSANANLAKGLAIEKSNNGSIVQAMAYYQKAVSDSSKITEAAARLNNMTSGLSTGNIREQALNEIALRKEWEKIWNDYRKWADENYYIEVVYSTDLMKKGDINFQTETLDIEVPVAIIAECEQVNRLYAQLESAYDSLPYNVKKWNLDTTRLPKKYFRGESSYPFTLTCSIYDARGVAIGVNRMSGSFRAGVYDYMDGGYSSYHASYCGSLSNKNGSRVKDSRDPDLTKGFKKSEMGVDAYLVQVSCKAETITDKISIKIETGGVPSVVVMDNKKSNAYDRNLLSGTYKYSYGKKTCEATAINRKLGGWRTDKSKRYPYDEYLYYIPDCFVLKLNGSEVVCQKTMFTDGRWGLIWENNNGRWEGTGYISDLYIKLEQTWTAAESKKKKK